MTGHNGTINGQGQSWWKKYRQKRLNYTRGPLVQIMWSSDILITNITLRDSPFWTLHPYDCKNITIKGVTILAPVFEAPNTDGIDPGKYPLPSTKRYSYLRCDLRFADQLYGLCRLLRGYVDRRLLHKCG